MAKINSYSPTTWNGGDEITAEKLTNIESGITQVTAAVVEAQNGDQSLHQRISAIESTAENAATQASVDALNTRMSAIDGAETNTLASKIADLQQTMGNTSLGVGNTVTSVLSNLSIPENLATRLSTVETNLALKANSSEIASALAAKADATGLQTVNTALNLLQTTVNTINTAVDGYNAVENEVLIAHGSQVLSQNFESIGARFEEIEGRVVDITGGVNVDSLSSLSNRISDLETDVGAASYVDEHEETQAATGLHLNVETLENDVADLKAEVGQFNSSRIDALETEVNEAHRVLENNEVDTLDNRFDDAEQRIAALETEVDINNSNGSRIDQLEVNVATKASATDLDTLSNTVNDATTGLAATKAIADAAVTSEELTSALSSKASTTITDALDTRLDAIDGGAALIGNTLVSRVAALENNPSSATVIINKNSITYNSNGIPTNIGQEASADKDYLLQGTDDRYYYWKYINNNWQLISGASGNSDDLIEDIKKYNIIKYTNNEEVSYLHFFEYDYGYDNSLDDTLARQFTNWVSETTYVVNDYVLYNNYIYQCITGNSDVTWDVTHWNNLHVKLLNTIELPQGGGGPASNTITISNLVRPTNISNGADAVFSFTATTSDESDITSIKWYVDGIEISPNEAVEMLPASGWGISGTTFKFNAKGLLKESDRSNVRVEMISEGAATFSRSWPIDSNEFSISWNNTIQPIMLYTNGNAVSTIVNVIAAASSNNIVEVTVNNHSKFQTVIGTNNVTFSLNAEWFNIGKNVVTAKLRNSADENEENVKTIHYIALWGYNATTPLVAFSNDEFEGQQYEEILINYYAYDPTNETTTITLTFNDGNSNPISRTAIVGREMQPYRYVSNNVGTITAQLTTTYEINETVQSVSDATTIKVNASSYNLGIVSGENLQYNFDPNGRSNNDLDKEQFAGNITFSENFDWINGGFKQDSNGSTAFVVKKGNTITLPRTLFLEDDDNGKTIDICFKVANSDIYDAEAIRDIDGNSSKGIVLKANYGELYLNNSTPQIFRYCEENRIDMSIHVEGTVNQRIVTVWLDGIPSYVGEYTSEMLEQKNTAATIIGSEHCDVWVYAIRVYNSALTEKDMVQNYIANGVNINDKIKRYTENNIYGSRTKTVSGQGIEYYSHTEITPEQLHIAMPDLTIVEIEADRMTKTKSDPVPAHVTITDRIQITEGNKVSYEDRITELNAATTDTSKDGCLFKVQGTSSVAYARSALNLDIDFKNCKDANQNSIKYKISDSSIGVNYFNIKANVASSENANNVCAVNWYNTYQPFTIEARKENSSVRDTIEAKPCAVFFKNTSANTIWIGSQQVAPGEQTLYFMGDLCNSKKNLAVFGEDGTGEHYTKCCIEDSGNDTPEQRFLAAPVYNSENDQWDSYDQNQGKYVKHFEWRMEPNEDDKQACITAWTETASWVVSTINNPEKFKAEFDQYFISQAMLYHFLMIEYFAAYDNVSKNTFYSFDWDENADQTKWGGYRWSVNKAYDWDTILAYDNDGKPLGDYGVDFGDTENGKSLFNAADNPIWNNIQTAYKNELNALYIQLRGQGAWNSNVIAQKWNEYQALRPHAAMVRDAYVKYIYPYKTTGVIIDTNPLGYDNNYIGRLAGSKIYQRTQYFTYQTSYMDGKYGYYNQNDALQFRTNGIAGTKDFTVKSYAKTYMTLIKDGQSLGSLKVEKGAEVIFQNATVGNNTTMSLTPNRLVQYIHPLNETQNSTFVASGANKLMEVVLGGNEINSSWSNTSNIVVPSPILKIIDLHNITTFASALNLGTNTELTTIDTRNTNAGNITIAPYAPLTSVHLNACSGLTLNHINTITNNNDFTIESGENLSYIRIEDCNYIIMSKIIDALEAELETKDFSQISVRITGLHGENGNNIPFQLSSTELLNKLQSAKAIDALGNSGIAPCVLAGRIHVPTIGSVELAHFNTIWPNLTITYDEQIQQQTIICVDEDEETELCSFQVQAGSNLIDPYVSGELQVAPTKAADVQYSYIFGELDQDEYIPFSGWRLENMSESIYSTYGRSPSIQVNDTTTLIATYSRTPQQYVVRWMLDSTHEVYRTPNAYNYGSGYTLSAPTIQYIHDKGLSTTTFSGSGSTCSYSIMTGWEKLPTNITPTTAGGTYDIYATWLTRTNVNVNDVLTSNDYDVAEKLLVLKNMQTARSTLSIQDLFPVVMGYNGSVEGHSLVSNPIRYTGTSTTINDYIPFAANKSFTIAIDYKFNYEQSSTADEAILLSCYDSTGDSKQGFKLFYNPRSVSPVPQISFGDTAAAYSSTNIRIIGNSITNRGMVVLRHQANDKTLYIYVGSDNTGLATQYSSSAFRKTITNQNFVPNTNARIVLGGINAQGDTSVINARGTLYSVRYWEEDLGEGECMQLASWCHETVHFAVSDYNGAAVHSAINSTLNASIVLHALNESQMGTITEPKISRTEAPNNLTIGWQPSTIRDFYNNRIYNGLPILLQSIINSVSIPYKIASYNQDTGYVINQSGVNISKDYVFAPSCVELGENRGNHSVEANGPFSWNNASQMTTLVYNEGSFESGNGSVNYSRLRFPYKNILLNPSATVYTKFPTTLGSFYTWASENSITLKEGDILIPENSLVAYIYVSTASVNAGAPIITDTSSNTYLATNNGGWIESKGWWTRSVLDSNSAGQIVKFIYIDTLGALVTSSNSVNVHGINCSIAI